jgi:D-alanyl-D-alanine carboxypeptidase/D-alanyl-D-alanine-endopeptidase (penicillin-binding protein 4)
MLGALLSAAAAPVLADAPSRSPRPPARPRARVAALSGAAPAAARPAAAAAPPAEALVEAARLGGRVSYAVLDAASGRLLEGREPAQPLPPASVAKAMTALYALDRLGAGHRFRTRLVATGPIAGGRVEGDLILAGGGDPTLTTDHLGDLAAALRAHGVRAVAGRFLWHGGGLPVIDRIAADQPDHVGYNPALAGLNLNFNRVHFEWRRGAQGWAVAMDARGERFVPQVAMARVRVVDRQAPLFTYTRRGALEDWTVAAAALGRGGSRWLPVRQPDRYAAEVFRTLARAQGIALPEADAATGAMPGGSVLAERASDALGTVLRDMLRHSTNITAEMVGLAASGARGLSDSAGRMSSWASGRFGIAPQFVDHSGLGAASRISAADMAAALWRAGPAGPLRAVLRDFPLREAGGKAAPQEVPKVQAKTGTLNFVSGLAGYVTCPGGRELVFAIFAADTARRNRLAEAERERPQGAPEWTRRARAMQAQLISRWAAVHRA